MLRAQQLARGEQWNVARNPQGFLVGGRGWSLSWCHLLCHLQLFPGDRAALVSVTRAVCWVKTKTWACFACLEVIRIPAHNNFGIFSMVLRLTRSCASLTGRVMCFSPLFKPWKWLRQVKLHLPHKHASVVWKQGVPQQPLKSSISVVADNVRHRMGWLFLIGLLRSHRIQTQAPGGNQEKNPSCTLVTGRCLSALHTQWIKSAWNRTSLKCIYMRSTLQPIQHHMS